MKDLILQCKINVSTSEVNNHNHDVSIRDITLTEESLNKISEYVCKKICDGMESKYVGKYN